MTPTAALALASLLAGLALPLGIVAPWRRVAWGLGLVALLAFMLFGGPPRAVASFLLALPAAGLLLAAAARARHDFAREDEYIAERRREAARLAAHHERSRAEIETRSLRLRGQTAAFDRLNRVAARYGRPATSAAVESITLEGAREILGGAARIESSAEDAPDPLPRRSALGGGRFAIMVPIVTTGAAAVHRRLIVEDEREWTTMDLRMLFSLAETAALAYEIASLAETAEHEASHDALTGLLLRRVFEVEAENRLILARRADRPCGLAIIDLDRFKSINDSFGHAAGDEVLRDFGRRVSGFLAENAATRSLVAGRVGGEEFAILGESMEDAALAATLDDLRREVAATCRRPDGAPLAFSAGVAGFPAAATEYAELTLLADKALYHAKASGRDRVAIFRHRVEASGA